MRTGIWIGALCSLVACGAFGTEAGEPSADAGGDAEATVLDAPALEDAAVSAPSDGGPDGFCAMQPPQELVFCDDFTTGFLDHWVDASADIATSGVTAHDGLVEMTLPATVEVDPKPPPTMPRAAITRAATAASGSGLPGFAEGAELTFAFEIGAYTKGEVTYAEFETGNLALRIVGKSEMPEQPVVLTLRVAGGTQHVGAQEIALGELGVNQGVRIGFSIRRGDDQKTFVYGIAPGAPTQSVEIAPDAVGKDATIQLGLEGKAAGAARFDDVLLRALSQAASP